MGKRAKGSIARGFIYCALILFSIFCCIPFFWLVRSSFMNIGQIFEMPPVWIPKPFTLSNYKEALTILPFGTYFLNTVRIVLIVLLGTILTSSLCAYSFARIDWKGRNIVFSIILSSLMLPYMVTLIPTFIGWSKVGLTNSIAPLVIPAWFGGGIFNVFLLRQFYMGIPKELDESAYIDGASHLKIYTKIILPLTKPALVAVGLFTFMNTWNDFLAPLIYLNSESKFTLAIGLQQFISMYSAQWHLLMAAATVSFLPVLLVFFIGQKHFIEGVTMTGLKG